ncbi:hypothetical protein ACLKA6_010281 [Drosophila palustris]
MSSDDYYCDYYVKPELDLSTGGAGMAGSSSSASSNGSGSGSGVGGGGGGVASQPLPAHQQALAQAQAQAQAHNDSRVSSTRNDSGALNSHQQSYDDMDASSLRSGDEDNDNVSDEVEELEAIDADFPYPIILDSNSPSSINGAAENGQTSMRKRRRNGETDELEDADIEGDDYEDQMLQQHRHLRQQQNAAAAAAVAAAGGLELPPPQTVREVLNSKFCGFISAKLNSMEDSEADNLMNRILLLVVQMQQCEAAK